jgi:CHAT domain-containing protein
LRRAQLAMLASPNQKYHSPYYWAAFAQFGGYVRY